MPRLDPSVTPSDDLNQYSYPDGQGSSAILINAVREHPYLPVSLPKKDFMNAAKKRWDELGLPKLNLKDPWYGYPLTAWTKENADEAKQAVSGQYFSTGEKLFNQRKPTGDFEDC